VESWRCRSIKLLHLGLLQCDELLLSRRQKALVLRYQLLPLGPLDLGLQIQKLLARGFFLGDRFIKVHELIEVVQEGERVGLRFEADPRRVALAETVDLEIGGAEVRVIEILDFAVLHAQQRVLLARLVLPAQVQLIGPNFGIDDAARARIADQAAYALKGGRFSRAATANNAIQIAESIPYDQIPCSTEQGILWTEQGILSREQGILRLFIHQDW
jgi:hypothetical protein